MRFRIPLGILFFLSSFSALTQVSLKNPQICHDKTGYLRCYNDGNYSLYFENGNFKKFKTADSVIKYSDVEKSLIICKRPDFDPLMGNTIQIQLLSNSIFIKEDSKTLEIVSLKNIPDKIREFSIGPYSIDSIVRGFIIYAGKRHIKIEISTYMKNWSWEIVIREPNQYFFIDYNPVRKNRMENIMMQNDSLKHGMSISMTFKSLKKIWLLEAGYIDVTRNINTSSFIRGIPPENYYSYTYNKAGKLNKKKVVGKIKLCDCKQ